MAKLVKAKLSKQIFSNYIFNKTGLQPVDRVHYVGVEWRGSKYF